MPALMIGGAVYSAIAGACFVRLAILYWHGDRVTWRDVGGAILWPGVVAVILTFPFRASPDEPDRPFR